METSVEIDQTCACIAGGKEENRAVGRRREKTFLLILTLLVAHTRQSSAKDRTSLLIPEKENAEGHYVQKGKKQIQLREKKKRGDGRGQRKKLDAIQSPSQMSKNMRMGA